MSFQESVNKYEKEVCTYCMNTNPDDCEIRICGNGLRCVNYIKDKSKFKENKKPISCWQGW